MVGEKMIEVKQPDRLWSLCDECQKSAVVKISAGQEQKNSMRLCDLCRLDLIALLSKWSYPRNRSDG